MKDKLPPFEDTGRNIRSLRKAKGISRQSLADSLNVDVSSLAGWESGKRLPRDKQRARLARALGTNAADLFPLDMPSSSSVALVDTLEELPDILMECLNRTKRSVRALRLAAPYTTPAHVQTDWRKRMDERLLEGSLEVMRIEIFYDLERLKEALSNILRYDGRGYYVKSYCAGLTEVAPFMGGYFFDDEEFLLGAYWTGVPPHHKPGLRMSGVSVQTFFNEYWNEIWRRGTLLNIRGGHDLSAVRLVAMKLGLPPDRWDQFVEEAKSLTIGDGAPPLV